MHLARLRTALPKLVRSLLQQGPPAQHGTSPAPPPALAPHHVLPSGGHLGHLRKQPSVGRGRACEGDAEVVRSMQANAASSGGGGGGCSESRQAAASWPGSVDVSTEWSAWHACNKSAELCAAVPWRTEHASPVAGQRKALRQVERGGMGARAASQIVLVTCHRLSLPAVQGSQRLRKAQATRCSRCRICRC